MKKDNERILIRKIQREADRESANKLIGTYYGEIYTFLYKQVGRKELAMDLTQEIFISVLLSIQGYDERKAQFRTWLYRIASNKVVDYFRSTVYKTSFYNVCLDDAIIPQETTLETDYIDKQSVEEILDELARLPFESQQIIRLKVYGEQSFREIATVLSLPEGTVKTRYYAAIKTVREKVMKK